MTNKCTGCGKIVRADGATCHVCSSISHRQCMSAKRRGKTSMLYCKKCTTTSPSSEVEAEPKSASPNTVDNHMIINQTGKDVSILLIQEIRLLRGELSTMSNELANFRSEVANIRSSISELNTKFVHIENRVSGLEERKCNGACDDTLIGEVFDELRFLMNERDQAILRNDLEIVGVHEEINEDPIQVIKMLSQDIGVALDEHDIVSAERLGPRRAHFGNDQSRPRRPRPLVVRFARRAVRDHLLRLARTRPHVSGKSTDTQPTSPSEARRSAVYVNERLTRMNYELFLKAREISRKKGWRYLWIRNGAIFTRQESNTQVHCIRQELDIKNIYENEN